MCFYFVADFPHCLQVANKVLIKIDAYIPSTPGIVRYSFSSQQVGLHVGICVAGVPGSPCSQENKIRLLRLWKGKANQPTNIWRGVIWGILDKPSFLTVVQKKLSLLPASLYP